MDGPWRRLTAVVVALAAGAIPGCREQAPDADAIAAARQNRGLIAFVGAGEHHPLWPILRASAVRYDRELCTLEVRYLCPKTDSPQEQINLLNSLTDRRLRGVCVQLENPPALEPTLRDLYNRGIRIMSMIKPAPLEVRIGHAGLDESAVGTALAEATVEVAGERGTIMLLHAGSKDPVYQLRRAAFSREIDAHRGIEVLAEIDCRQDPFEARKAIRERSARYPRLSAWVSLDDWALRGVGLTEQPLPTGCRMITFGGYPDQWPLIRNGVCPVVVAANYHELGGQALQACEVATRHVSRHQANYEAPLRTVHQSNLDAYIRDWWSWLQEERPGPAQAISSVGPDGTPGLTLGGLSPDDRWLTATGD